MLSDLRFTLRTILRARSFTFVTVLTLALGIGSAAAIFSVTDWVLFRANSLPDDVHLIGGRNDTTPSMPVRFDFMARAYAEQSTAIEQYAKSVGMSGNIVVDHEPVATSWMGVSANFFGLFDITPALGRGFLDGEDVEGRDQVVVVSHRFWQEHLGARDDVLGRQITVGDQSCTVVGVLRRGQVFPVYGYGEVYRPLAYRVDPATPWMPQLLLWGRTRPGLTREQAQLALDAVRVDVPPALAPYLVNDHPVLTSMKELNQLMRAEIHWMMLGAVGFLYAIACLNASNLVLVRMIGQRREFSIRLALGGDRWRLVRLLALQSVSLAAIASIFGALVANWVLPILMFVAGSPSTRDLDLAGWHLDWRVLAVLAMLSIVTSLIIVIIPAVRVLRTDIQAGLKDGGAALGESRALARLRGAFIVLQAAFAVILLAGSGLMIRTFQRLQQVDAGFDPAGRVKVQLGFPADFAPDSETRLVRLREIQSELARLPGVASVGFGDDVMLAGYYFSQSSFETPSGTPIRAMMRAFSIGFEQASGLRLKSGRWLTQSNGNELLVSESFARTCWPGEDPIGQFVRPVGGNPSAPADWKGWVVIGVVGDVRPTVRGAAEHYVYTPEVWGAQGFNTYVVKCTRAYDEAMAGTIRRTLYAFNPRLVVTQVASFDEARANQLWAERLANSVLKVLAGIALILTIVGVFSVLAYTVDCRMGEFGVRVAHGATPRDLVRLVLRRGALLTCAGVVLGIGSALVLTRTMQSLLYETSPMDPWILGAVAATVLATAVLACVHPALRASKVEVSRLLRSDY